MPATDSSNATPAADATLMGRIVQRDEYAFKLLAERHTPTLLRVARRIVRSVGDAEDVVQESLVRAWTFSHRWNPAAGRVSDWLYRIVINQAISHIRKRTTDSLDAIDEPPDSAPNAFEQVAGAEIRCAIDDAVERLPKRQKAAVSLCYDLGLSSSEAAKAMGVSVGTMESLLFRARRSLREWLDPIRAELAKD